MSELDHPFVPQQPDDRWLCHAILEETQDGNPIICGKSLRDHPNADPKHTTFPLEPKDGP